MLNQVSFFSPTAPEILRQNGYTKQVDIWSLGCITYTLLSGVSPFQEAQDQQELCGFL